MDITLKRLDVEKPFRLEAVNERGRVTYFDGSEKIGGGSEFTPMEHLAAALAGCSSIDVLMILEKQKLKPAFYAVQCKAVRRDEVPAIFESIHLVFQFSKEVPEQAAKRAVDLSIEKYCSVSKILSPTCLITYEIEILEN